MITARKEKRSFDKLRTSGEGKIEASEMVLQSLHKAAVAAHPSEACGILLGSGDKITRFVETANVHEAPETHFEIDPQALIDAYRAHRAGGAEVLGYFHSHPKGPASPSKTDQDMAARDGKIWAIWGEGEIRFWRDAGAGFEPLSYRVTDS